MFGTNLTGLTIANAWRALSLGWHLVFGVLVLKEGWWTNRRAASVASRGGAAAVVFSLTGCIIPPGPLVSAPHVAGTDTAFRVIAWPPTVPPRIGVCVWRLGP